MLSLARRDRAHTRGEPGKMTAFKPGVWGGRDRDINVLGVRGRSFEDGSSQGGAKLRLPNSAKRTSFFAARI